MSFDAAAQALVESGEVGEHWLIELQLSSGNVYLTTFNQTRTIGGKTYLGLGDNLEVDALKETDRLSNDKVTLALPASSQALVALVITDVEAYRGRTALLSLQLFDANGRPVGAPVLRLRAEMEPASIRYDDRRRGSAGGKINIDLIKQGRGRSRRLEGRRINDAQQRAEYPGDTGIRYQRGLIEKPSVWLTKEFQKQ